MPQLVSRGASGGAFDALEAALLQQEMLKRQAMLDDLNKRNIESQLADREMNRKIQGQNADSLEQQRQATATKTERDEFLKTATPGMLMTPEIKHVLGPGAEGMTKVEGGAGLPDGGEGPTKIETFAGTPQEQAQRKLAKSISEAANRKDAVRLAMDAGVPFDKIDEMVNSLFKTEPEKAKPGIIAEFEYNNEERVKRGEKPLTFEQYQDADANRKKTGDGEDGAIGVWGPREIDMAAKAFAKTYQYPGIGRSKEALAVIKQITHRASYYDPATDSFLDDETTAVPDLASAGSTYAANKAAEKTLTGNINAVEAFSRTAQRNAGLLREAMKLIPETGYPFLNKPVRSLSREFGGEAVAKFNALRNSIVSEYGRININPNLTGVLPVSVRDEMEKIIGQDMTVEQMKSVLDILASEAANREQEYKAQLGQIRGDIKGGGVAPVGAKPKTAEELIKQYSTGGVQ